ncbi:hypothetical protein [Erythrobacter sp. EC-HK427]|uniref:hypothetical protein n=1 Tax=Erythrobacter sp. EC-HK427 TaxID=2038396 RepID=UPI001254CA74|nr:hypothetical protein [Erythrobacter sp. EC-HK427]VVT00979.1 conserved hypothetical protein [Erythrobacter sp. EC-HK427]
MSSFADFLERNSIVPSPSLPLVHSLPSYSLTNKVMPSDAIVPLMCDVFEGEKLNYFFVGRPAYKSMSTDAVAAEWELPCCFIFDYQSLGTFKRVFPFDSGAHDGKRYPEYIQMMELEKFDVTNVLDAPARIIGAYFRNVRDYFLLNPKSEEAFKQEFSITPLDAEIMAVHRLAGDNRYRDKYDDRRLAVEIQSEEQVDLTVKKPLAVILPCSYGDVPEVRDAIEGRWGADIITYTIQSLSVEAYYSTIYEKVLNFYEAKGLIKKP